MALKRVPRRGPAPRAVLAGLLASAAISLPIQSLAVDLRVEKAKAVRDEILAKRAASGQVPRSGSKAANPASSSGKPAARGGGEAVGEAAGASGDPAVDTARARLADIDARIEESRRRSEAQAAPRDKLAARADELTAERNRIDEAERARVEAVYRSAKLGAGAAGWDPDPARTARLSRYLAAVAGAQQDRLSKLEVEQGSVLASLDRARSEAASAEAERKVLEADRSQAQAALDRALEASTGSEPAREPLAEPGVDDGPGELDSAAEVERAMAAAAAKLAASGHAPAGPGAGAALPGGLAAPPAGPAASAGDDFHWPAGIPPASTPLPPSATAAGAATASAASPESGDAGDAVDGEAETTPDGGTAVDGELEDGPAVLAPSADAAPPGSADGTLPSRPPGLLQRLFDDGESDRFASARGTLPVPVGGKVVANYGQQHKSGSTYRGVILRATHGAPVRSVAAGQVSFVGNVAGLGNTVIVSHGSRYHTVYGRLGKVRVKQGDKVDAGTRVGELPDNDADMHFELRDEGKAVNPVPWLKPGVPGAAP